MPAILPNYEYDIFISYRQNDNKRDGWVTKFVAALKDELEATLKNPVTIYFDENPHDGLLETHQVNESLATKLKCLVFIPIISQTYCDTSSFAWEHEFLPFINIANEDELGMNIKLENGNVASRVLPIKIHDLDSVDQKTLENTLGGPLRCIDFIYKEPGVNRPLSPDDSENKNLDKTRYKNQINKVANALKELGNGMLQNNKTESAPKDLNKPIQNEGDTTSKKSIFPKLAIAAAVVLLGVLSIFMYSKSSSGISGTHDYDIAVMYLENLTDDPKYGEGLVNLIQINLSEDTSLNLVPRQKLYDELREINGSSKGPDRSVATELAKETDAEFMIIGSVIQQKLEVLAQVELIEVATGKVVSTKKVQGAKEEIFLLADNITKQLMRGRVPERNYNVTSLTTGNYDAYQLYYDGIEHLWDLEFNEASTKFKQAIQLDSTFALAYMYNAVATNPFRDWDIYQDLGESNSYLEQAYGMSSTLPVNEKLMVQMMYEQSTSSPNYPITLNKLLEKDPNNRLAINMIAIAAFSKGGEKANIKVVEDYLGRNPKDDAAWNNLAYMYQDNGEPSKAIFAVGKYLELRPDLYNAYHSSWEISVMTGDYENAILYAEQLENNFKVGARGAWRGLTQLIMGNPSQAFNAFRTYRDSTNIRDLQSLGVSALLMQGKLNQSLQLIDEVVGHYKEVGQPKVARTIELSKPVILLRFEQNKAAIKELNRIISEVRNDRSLTVIYFMAEYYKGISYTLTNNIEAATEQVNILTELGTSGIADQRFDLYVNLLQAELALSLNELDKAVSYLESNKKLFHENNASFYSISLRYLIIEGRFEEALEILNNMNSNMLSGRYSFGGNPTLYTLNLMYRDYYRGIIFEKQKQPQDAIVAYNAFIELLKDSDPGIKEKEYAKERVKELIK